mmetsp:Transcript_79865/g.191755  ORF Transcript_79865/g.191755 Transcript_79865/m.191755 type:complete len:617 (+) Transcript_79865:21-1871(+)
MVVRNVRLDNGRGLLEMLEHLGTSAESDIVAVRILAAADHDGVCSAKMLSRMLTTKRVKFIVVPVMENEDIFKHFRELKEDTEVHSLVLLNCGASVDLQKQLLDSEAGDHVKCFVIDSHRPVVLENLSKHNQKVIVLDDDPIADARGERPPVEEYDDSDVEEEGSEDDKENVWEPGGKRSFERKEKLQRKRARVQEHYLTSYHAMPVAMSMFQMARQAAPASPDFLWLAAVGLLGYMDLGLMSEHQYSRLAWEELKEALDTSNETLLSTASLSPGEDEDPDPRRGSNAAEAKERRLRFESDLRLTLYKHWTLEESMMHSAYVYGTLELHRDTGLRTLKSFFAKCGLVPSDYTQVFRHMSPPLRNSLRQIFTEHGKEFGFTETRVFLDQFVQDLGIVQQENFLQPQFSSSDVVHLLQAMLCSSSFATVPQLPDGRKDLEAIERLEKEDMWNNFYRAFDSVLCDDPSLLREGILESVELSKAVQSLARQIRDTKAMKATRKFRWCRIDQPGLVFRRPLAVRKLAMWLSQTNFTFRPSRGAELERPLLVVVRDYVNDAYLCVGATPPSVSDQDEFAHLFRDVLKQNSSLRYRYDFFDRSCILVAADDIDRFLKALTQKS